LCNFLLLYKRKIFVLPVSLAQFIFCDQKLYLYIGITSLCLYIITIKF